MTHSVGMLCMAVALPCVLFSAISEAGVTDLTAHLGRLQNALQPRHCGHLRQAVQRSSGVYTIYHKAANKSGELVYCDMEMDGGGWTRRGQYGNSIFYFYRKWNDYATGFGSTEKEYWIGNRALHALTNGEDQMTLRVVLSKSSGESVSFDYGSFKIASEEDHFRISIRDFRRAGGSERRSSRRRDAFRQDGLSEMNRRTFSTFDRNSSPGINCAALNRGAWWFKDCNGSNLNGVNFNGEHFYPGNGIQWKGRGIFGVSDWSKYSYPSVRVMIRPAGGLKDTSTRQRFPAKIREANFKLERKHWMTKTKKLGK